MWTEGQTHAAFCFRKMPTPPHLWSCFSIVTQAITNWNALGVVHCKHLTRLWSRDSHGVNGHVFTVLYLLSYFSCVCPVFFGLNDGQWLSRGEEVGCGCLPARALLQRSAGQTVVAPGGSQYEQVRSVLISNRSPRDLDSCFVESIWWKPPDGSVYQVFAMFLFQSRFGARYWTSARLCVTILFSVWGNRATGNTVFLHTQTPDDNTLLAVER